MEALEKTATLKRKRFQEGRKTSDIVLFREPGKNIVSLIAKLTARGTIASIEGLIANSYDSDATSVHVEYNPSEKTFSVIDNGEGMRAGEGLEDFYRLGDSPKVKNPVSTAGRRRIGKFGVETIVLESICTGYDLVTARDGFETRISEEFDGELTTEKRIVGVTIKPYS